jgi:FMN phosphatase YigB (HAD superfamily)
MSHFDPPNYRQQRALDAIDRAAIDFDIAIRAHAPTTEAVRQARSTLLAVAEMVKLAIMTNGKAPPK